MLYVDAESLPRFQDDIVLPRFQAVVCYVDDTSLPRFQGGIAIR